MLTIQRSGPSSESFGGSAPPRIAPVHDVIDRKHSDLGFSIDTGGRPAFRVLIARDRALFAPEQQAARNASNFYDSQREGLLPFDGLPCFYLVPRSALNAMLPTGRLYYTLIAYEDRNGARAAYAIAPESLAREAPSVAVAADLVGGSLGFMFGTPVERLMPVAAAAGRTLSVAETGEDLGLDAPEATGLADSDGDDDVSAYELADEDPEYEDGARAAAADDDYDDGYRGADTQAYAESAEDGDCDDAPAARTLADGHDDGYDDGYDDGLGESASTQAEDADLAEAYDDDYGVEPAAEALALGAPPEMLPDEDADPHGAAQGGGAGSADEVDIEGEARGLAEEPAPTVARRPFDIEACKAVLARIMPFESGAEGFARVQPDGEFAGRFGTAHPAYQRFHLGLSFGAFPFVQEHGTLGQLLSLMRERDGAAFERIFGRDDAAALVAVTNAGEGPRAWEAADGLSARLRPVGNAVLWQEPWLTRFRTAGAHPPFQGAQNELAARLFVSPVMGFATQLGLDSEQALTLLVDRAVQMGPASAMAWVLEAVSPVPTRAHRQQVLATLGQADLRAFQTSQHLPATGEWDVATHAALIATLRQRKDTPVPLPTREQMVDAMLRRAEGTPWAERMRRLRTAVPADRLLAL